MKGKLIDSYEYNDFWTEEDEAEAQQTRKDLQESIDAAADAFKEFSKNNESVKKLNAHSSNVSFMDVAKYSDSRTEKERREDREFLREYRRLKLELLRRKIINCRLRNLELEYSVYGYNGQGEPEFDLYD